MVIEHCRERRAVRPCHDVPHVLTVEQHRGSVQAFSGHVSPNVFELARGVVARGRFDSRRDERFDVSVDAAELAQYCDEYLSRERPRRRSVRGGRKVTRLRQHLAIYRNRTEKIALSFGAMCAH